MTPANVYNCLYANVTTELQNLSRYKMNAPNLKPQ